LDVANDYTTDSIEVLTPVEAVRKRPGMYIGGTDRRAMHRLLWGLVDNAIDDTRA
jgi:DNA gyrase/topoisomerase IV subunit B